MATEKEEKLYQDRLKKLEALRKLGMDPFPVKGERTHTVAEVLAESSEDKVLFKRIGLPSSFASMIGDQNYLRSAYGLSKEAISNSIKSFLGTVRK